MDFRIPEAGQYTNYFEPALSSSIFTQPFADDIPLYSSSLGSIDELRKNLNAQMEAMRLQTEQIQKQYQQMAPTQPLAFPWQYPAAGTGHETEMAHNPMTGEPMTEWQQKQIGRVGYYTSVPEAVLADFLQMGEDNTYIVKEGDTLDDIAEAIKLANPDEFGNVSTEIIVERLKDQIKLRDLTKLKADTEIDLSAYISDEALEKAREHHAPHTSHGQSHAPTPLFGQAGVSISSGTGISGFLVDKPLEVHEPEEDREKDSGKTHDTSASETRAEEEEDDHASEESSGNLSELRTERYKPGGAEKEYFRHTDFESNPLISERNVVINDDGTSNPWPFGPGGDPLVMTGLQVDKGSVTIDNTKMDSDGVVTANTLDSTFTYQGQNHEDAFVKADGQNSELNIDVSRGQGGSPDDEKIIVANSADSDTNVTLGEGDSFVQGISDGGTFNVKRNGGNSQSLLPIGNANTIISLQGNHINRDEKGARTVELGNGDDKQFYHVDDSKLALKPGNGKNDTVIQGSSNAFSYEGGKDADTLGLNGSKNTLNASMGEGDDKLLLSGDDNTATIEGGAGKDTYHIEGAGNHYTLKADKDDMVYLNGAKGDWTETTDGSGNKVYQNRETDTEVTVKGEAKEVLFTANDDGKTGEQEKKPVSQQISEYFSSVRDEAAGWVNTHVGTQDGQDVASAHFKGSGVMGEFQAVTNLAFSWLS